MRCIELEVNGQQTEVVVSTRQRLSSVIRGVLGLKGTKVGCEEGACGSCAVLVDGRPIPSCLLLAVAAEGRSITTIEGITEDGLTPLQRAFVREDALQCGFCTPGQVVVATALLARNERPSRADIRSALVGNLCRCGAYPRIEAAILRVVDGSDDAV